MDSATSYMAAKNTMYFYSPPGKVPPLLHAYPQYQYYFASTHLYTWLK